MLRNWGQGNNGQTVNWGSFPGNLLPQSFSLTRASANATYFDSAGLLQTAGANVARGTYRYNGSAWVFDGTMIEQAATNILVNPYDHTAGSWSVAGTTALVANYYTGLSGSQNMDAAVVTAGGAASQIVFQGSVNRTATDWVDSLDVKYDSHRWVCLWQWDPTAGYKYASFDLLNGVVGALSASTTSGITPLGNGFYRIHISSVRSATAGGQAGLILNNTDNAGFDTWAPAGTTRVGFGFFQSELGTAPTSRVVGTRNADIPTATTSGLLVNAQGFAAMKFRVIAVGSDAGILSSYNGAGGINFEFSGGVLYLEDSAGFKAGPAFSPAAGGVYSLGMSYAGSSANAAINGTVSAFASFSGNMAYNATLQIGNHPSGADQPISMVLQSMRLGVVAASSSKLAAMTS